MAFLALRVVQLAVQRVYWKVLRQLLTSVVRCSVTFLTNGGNDEKNNCVSSGNCAGWRICRRAVHFMPVRLCCGCRGLYGHREQFMSIGLCVRRHRNQLYRIHPRRFVHNVRTSEHYIQRQHRLIRIRPGLRHGIDHPGLRPPLRRGKLCSRSTAE